MIHISSLEIYGNRAICKLSDYFKIDLSKILNDYNIRHLAYHNYTHAISTMYFADMLYRLYHKKLNKVDKNVIMLAALMHDIGYQMVYSVCDEINIRNAHNIIDNLCETQNTSYKFYKNVSLIKKYISFTKFPWDKCLKLTKTEKYIMNILRAADISQIFIKSIDRIRLLNNLYNEELHLDINNNFDISVRAINFYNNMSKNNYVFKKLWDKFLRNYI